MVYDNTKGKGRQAGITLLSSIAPPVSSFLREIMPTDKTIAPFCTHGGGIEGHIARDVRSYCIGCDVLPLLDGGTRAETQVEQWLKHIKL